MAENPEPSLLQRRARRRLIGAIALVVFIVIVLPIVLDKEPGPIGQDIVIQIPSQDAGKFKSRVVPGPETAPAKAEPPAAPAKPPSAADPAGAAPPAQKEQKGQAASANEPAARDPSAKEPATRSPVAKEPVIKDPADSARAKALLEAKESWVVPLGAFSSAENVKHLQARLAETGMKSFTESVKTSQGAQTRVRAGPFESRAAAEHAREKLVAMGLRPAAVTAR